YLCERMRDLPQEVRDLLARYQKIWARKNLNERSKFFRSRRYYVLLRDWIGKEQEKHFELSLDSIKKDRLELTGGKIEPHEFQKYPLSYPAYAATRELVEESGLLAEETEEVDGVRIIHDLFECIGVFYTDDFELKPGNHQYENWALWVNAVSKEQMRAVDQNGFPALRETGVKDENFPPFYMPISKLERHNFHPKHGYILLCALLKMTANGHTEYQSAIEHLFTRFANEQQYILSERPEYVEPENIPEPQGSDEETFAQAMSGVVPLR
ncbi:MAG: hypothetical protein AAB795_03755, partial [Patescibacteria group bacterium]